MQYLSSLLVFLFLSFSITPANAALIYESESLPTIQSDYGGISVSNSYWSFQNFELKESTRIGAIGAYFENYGVAQTVFAAIVSLDSLFDQPDSVDLSTPDLLSTTLFTVENSKGADFQAVVDIFLSPGFYAVGFGQGMFGADNVPDYGTVLLKDVLVNYTDSTSPSLPYTAIQTVNPFNIPAGITLQGASPRFFVKSFEPVSSPSSILLLVGALTLLFRLRSKV